MSPHARIEIRRGNRLLFVTYPLWKRIWLTITFRAP